MSEALSGKVVLVTGGVKRVGAAIARRLHREGANLMLHYRGSEREARALRAELNVARADSVALVQADLLDIAGLSEIVRNTLGRFERLDALVNNASTFFPTPVGEMTQATWDSLMGANLRAPLFLSQAAAPHLRKVGGAIVNITDIHVDRPLKNYVIYSIAKAGLAGLTRSLARELAPEVRVNGVAPGAIVWPEDGSWDDLTRQRIVSHTLLRRTGDPDDVARAVYYLLAEAPYVTGQIIAVDGGRRPRHGMPLRRRGQLRAARRALEAARALAGFLRPHRREPGSAPPRVSRARSARVPRLARHPLPHRGAGHLFRGEARRPRRRDDVRAVLAVAPWRPLPRRARGGCGQDRARPPPRRHPGNVFPQPLLRRQDEGHVAEAAVRRRETRCYPAARLRGGKGPRSVRADQGLPDHPLRPVRVAAYAAAKAGQGDAARVGKAPSRPDRIHVPRAFGSRALAPHGPEALRFRRCARDRKNVGRRR